MENKEFKGLKIINANVHKLNILEELAKTSRINAQSVMTNNETIQSIVNELNRTDTHVNITNSTFKTNNSIEPIISIETDSFPNNEELISSEYSEDVRDILNEFADELLEKIFDLVDSYEKEVSE